MHLQDGQESKDTSKRQKGSHACSGSGGGVTAANTQLRPAQLAAEAAKRSAVSRDARVHLGTGGSKKMKAAQQVCPEYSMYIVCVLACSCY